MYYVSKVKFESFENNSGKLKKVYETYIVEADSISNAEEKLKKRFINGISDFSVVSIQESKILGIISD